MLPLLLLYTVTLLHLLVIPLYHLNAWCEYLEYKRRSLKCTAIVIHPHYVKDQMLRELEMKRCNVSSQIRLPHEILPLALLDYMDAKDLCTLSMVSKSWYFLSSQDLLWQRHLLAEFHTDIRELKNPTSMNAKAVYRSLYIARRELYIEEFVLRAAELVNTNFNVPIHIATAIVS